jgi:hypothetical protein
VDEWVDKARINTHRNLEKLVAANNPDVGLGVGIGESVRYLTEKSVEVRLTMTEAEYLEFKRAQELLCQKMRRPVTLQKTLSHAVGEDLRRNDPVLRAQRQLEKCKKRKKDIEKAKDKIDGMGCKGKVNDNSNDNIIEIPSVRPGTCQKNRTNRAAIPRILLHQIYQRDQGKCQEKLPGGSPCHQSKWIELHHKIPISRGGSHTLENLKTLCSGHHKLEHQKKWLR